MKIISGGQTGADRGALEAAKKCGVETGGYAPRGYLTEFGKDITLKDFGLIDSGTWYPERTALNVQNSDLTIWFGKEDTAGFMATYNSAKKYNKPFINVTKHSVHEIKLIIRDIKVLNVSGNRESLSPGIQKKVEEIMTAVLTNDL